MKNLRTSLVCLALLASAAACSDANPLTAPGAPRFDGGGAKGSGYRADDLTLSAAEAGGGMYGSGNKDGVGGHGSGNSVSTADGGGTHGSGGKDGGGFQGSGGITSTEDGPLVGSGSIAPDPEKGGGVKGSGG